MGMHFPGAGQLGAGSVLEHSHSLPINFGLGGDIGTVLGVVGQLVGFPVVVNIDNLIRGLQRSLVKGLGLEVGDLLGLGRGHLAVGTFDDLVRVFVEILLVFCAIIQSLEPVLNRIAHGIRREGNGDRYFRFRIRQRQGENTVLGDVTTLRNRSVIKRSGIILVNINFGAEDAFVLFIEGNDLHDGRPNDNIVLHHIDGDANQTAIRFELHIVKGALIDGIGSGAGSTALHHGPVAIRHRIAQNRTAPSGGRVLQGDFLGLRQHHAGTLVSIGRGIQLAIHKGGSGNGGGDLLVSVPAVALHIQRVGQVDGVLFLLRFLIVRRNLGAE